MSSQHPFYRSARMAAQLEIENIRDRKVRSAERAFGIPPVQPEYPLAKQRRIMADPANRNPQDCDFDDTHPCQHLLMSRSEPKACGIRRESRITPRWLNEDFALALNCLECRIPVWRRQCSLFLDMGCPDYAYKMWTEETVNELLEERRVFVSETRPSDHFFLICCGREECSKKFAEVLESRLFK